MYAISASATVQILYATALCTVSYGQNGAQQPTGPPQMPAAWLDSGATEGLTTDWSYMTDATTTDIATSTMDTAAPWGPSTHPPSFAYCSAQDDPHLLTFDGSAYEMQTEGEFFLYKHKTAPIWVQAGFQSCGAEGASCSCAAAVRYYDEAFVVDKCVRSSLGQPVNMVFRTGSGALMNISTYFSGFQVQLPNGLRVHIARYDVGVRNVDIRATSGDENLVEGLCGAFNNDVRDDFTWRTGIVTSADEHYPYSFADSWRVQDGENLFDSGTLQILAPCTQTFNAPRGPAEVADSCQLSLPPSAFLGNDLPPLAPENRRRKRQSGGQSFPDGDWPIGWNYTTAVIFCYQVVATSPVQQCSALVGGDVDISLYVMNCARDIYLTGGTSFWIAALNAALTRCMQALLDRSIATPQWLVDALCPFNCSSHGACSSGLCYCDAGWGSFHCGVNMSSPLSLLYYVPSPACRSLQSGKKRCRAAYVYGAVFVNTTTLAVRANIYPLENPSDARDVRVRLSYITSGMVEVMLRLPFCPRSWTDYGSNLTMSNDGVHFSSPLALRIVNTRSSGKR